MKKTLIILMIMSFVSCSHNLDRRLEQIEKDYSIELPCNFQVIQDDDISYNGFESDYEQIVTIQFEKPEFDSVKSQIENTAYFNQLTKFEDQSIKTIDKSSPEHQIIIDSLYKIKQSGAWIIREDKYVFLYFGDWKDFVQGNLDLSAKTLTWNHHHL